jgi:FlaA1/EpsC-like NDP-sugar epimerase
VNRLRSGKKFSAHAQVRVNLFGLSRLVLAWPRTIKRFVAILVDLGLCVLATWLAFYLRLGEFLPLSGNTLWPLIVSIGLALPIFIAYGLYRAIFRYSGWPALLIIIRAVATYGVIYTAIFTAVGVVDVPRTIGLIQPILLLLFVGASRSLASAWFGREYQAIIRRSSRLNVLIYGAGNSGRQLAAAMENNSDMRVVGFLDDDPNLQGQILNGKHIYEPTALTKLSSTLNVSAVLLAMPSISRHRRNQILDDIRRAQVSVRTIPSVTDLAKGTVSVSDLRELDIEDLLGRDLVSPKNSLLSLNLTDNIVMVTGAGGSIGSELCRQIFLLRPRKLLLVEQNEFALYAIHQELHESPHRADTQLIPLLGSVQDKIRMREILLMWRPSTVYHAAAYKHVPLVEHNPEEGIKNNVFGTLVMAQAAAESGVVNFVLISTDKAVRPANIMGASKRLAEIILQALSREALATNFSMVRFGNVLGSSGSVVPKFREQIRNGGPITLTHPEITRYFMTIPEAAQLVIQSGAMAIGGDVFVLDMGEPVKIIDLARQMVELSGLTIKDKKNPQGDIEIQITGLRPGEKLYEELLIGNNPQRTLHPRIMKATEDFISWHALNTHLSQLQEALNTHNIIAIRAILQNLVAGYSPAVETVDWITIEKESKVNDCDAHFKVP